MQSTIIARPKMKMKEITLINATSAEKDGV